MNISYTLAKPARYLYRNFVLPEILTHRHRSILRRNRAVKDRFKKQRCFIIGSGPSSNQFDLGALRNEQTFVCAEFDNHTQFSKLLPTYYILNDSAYFTPSASEYWPEQFRKKSRTIDTATTIFVNIDAQPYIRQHGLFKNHRLFSIGTQGNMTQKIPFSINIDRYIPWPKNSVLLCLIIAVYMGFENIYLLGCEHNFLSHRATSGKPVLAYDHGYKDILANLDPTNDEVVKKYATPKDIAMNYEDVIGHVYQLFKNYRLFYKKVRAIHPDTHIFNATPESFLDVFPSVNFTDIVNAQKIDA